MTSCLVPSEKMYHFVDFYRNANITVPTKTSDIDDMVSFNKKMIDGYYPNILLKSKYNHMGDDPTINFSPDDESKQSKNTVVEAAVKKNRFSLLYAGDAFKFNPANNDYIKSVIEDINRGIISDPVEPQVKKGKK